MKRARHAGACFGRAVERRCDDGDAHSLPSSFIHLLWKCQVVEELQEHIKEAALEIICAETKL